MTTDTQWASIRDFSNLRFIESKMPPILLHDLNLEIDKLSEMTDNLIKKLFKDADTDYIWLTEPVSRVDPCEKLRGRRK